MPRNLYMRYYLTAALIVIVDQITKVLIRANIEVGQSISVIGDFFRITYIRNSGAAFSMLSGMRIFLILIPIIAIVICIIYLNKHRDIPCIGKLSLWMIIAGGAGNLIDRVFFGPVTDMFSFSIFPPVFNVADIAVTIGCVLLVIYILFEEKIKEKYGK